MVHNKNSSSSSIDEDDGMHSGELENANVYQNVKVYENELVEKRGDDNEEGDCDDMQVKTE